MSPPSQEPFALSPAEAAHQLGVSRQTVYSLINRGALTPYKIGRATRLNTAQVHALVGGADDAPAA